MRVRLSEQVVGFVRRLPPEPKRRLRRALRDLASGRGDLKRLEGPLDGYCRLRVGGYRIVFAYAEDGSMECVFAEQRSLVYEVMLEVLRDRLLE
jgi:mRNA-degrading endonuclease RelE of RelBE toxin-antitoxin system